MKVQTYSMFEGNFQSPPPVIDRSVNIMMFRDPDENEYTIMINRATLENEQDIESFCELQIGELKNKLPGYQQDGKLLKNVIGPAKLPVVQIANHYLQDGATVNQVQTVMKLPWHAEHNVDEREVIIFTLYARGEYSEFQRKHYVQVINTFQPQTSLMD